MAPGGGVGQRDTRLFSPLRSGVEASRRRLRFLPVKALREMCGLSPRAAEPQAPPGAERGGAAGGAESRSGLSRPRPRAGGSGPNLASQTWA